MPRLIESSTRIPADGEPPKLIDEYVGRVNTGDAEVSVAHMRSPSGWSEPGQRPDFDEFTVVLRGTLVVEHESGELTVGPGQAVHSAPGEWVRYRTPGPEGAEYVAICLPAFAPDTVHRDAIPRDTIRGDTIRGDTIRGDTIHGDTIHGDTIHGDTVHGDTVHGDTVRAEGEGRPPATSKRP